MAAQTPLQTAESQNQSQYDASTNPGGTLGAPNGTYSNPTNPNTGVIPATSLAPITPVTLPPTPTPTPVPPPTLPTPATDTTTDPNAIPSSLQNYLDESTPPPSTESIYANDVNAANILGFQGNAANATNAVAQEQANLDAINAQLKAVSDTGTQANFQLESGAAGKDITSAFLGKQQQEVTRQAGIQALPLQAQALASQAKIASLQGNATAANTLLTNAQNQVDKLFSIQSTDAQNKYNYQQSLIKTVYDYANTAQQTKLDEQKQALQNDFTVKQDAIKNAQALANTALTNGDAATAAKIMGLDPTSPTYNSDLATIVAGMSTQANVFGGSSTGEGASTSIAQILQTNSGVNIDITQPLSVVMNQVNATDLQNAIIQNEGKSLTGVTNNPGNVGFANQPGATDSGVKIPGTNMDFANFVTKQQGLDAITNQLQIYAKQGMSFQQALDTYTGTNKTSTPPTVTMTANNVPNPQQQATFLNSITNPQVKTLVQGIANYTINPASIPTRNYKGVGGLTQQQIVALAQQYDPSYNEAQYATRQALIQNFTSGSYSQNINALNTAIGHIKDLQSSFAPLNNGNIPLLNTAGQSIASAFGSGAPGAAALNISAATGEIASVFKSGGATDTEIKNLGTLSTSSSPNQVKAYMEKATQLLSSRLQALTDTYTSGMGKAPQNSFLSPTSQQALQDLQKSGLTIDASLLPTSTGQITVGQTATNPQTGAKVQWDGTNWVPK